MEIDETLTAVELEKAGNIILLSNSNSFTESLGIGKANCRKLILRCLGELLVENKQLSIGRNHNRGSTLAAAFI